MNRRAFLQASALLAQYPVRERLDQGPFDIDQDEGWQTVLFTTPTDRPLRNPGLGLAGYAWEENGPSLAARAGRETIAQHVEKLASLPFVDVLYIRCDWRDVQSRPGRLDLHPVWRLTLDAAHQHGLRVAFRIQMSKPELQPKQLALPDFLSAHVPLVKIGRIPRASEGEYVEPRYDHPEFRRAFAELQHLLAAEFDAQPYMEWVDLMQYGFWGEGHTSNFPNPFPDHATAVRTFRDLTALQLETWKRTPLAVNTQPDISNVGNRETVEMAMRAGAWLRSDSIKVEEPIQIAQIANRPPWLAAILDVKANYWALWTEADNLKSFNEQHPRGFHDLRANLGYRIRPAWVWQRKRQGTMELVISISNRGVAGVPGVL